MHTGIIHTLDEIMKNNCIFRREKTTISNCAFCVYGSCTILSVNRDYFLTQQKQINLLIIKCCVFFEVHPEFLNTNYISGDFRELRKLIAVVQIQENKNQLRYFRQK
jgi:hypothetical protein